MKAIRDNFNYVHDRVNYTGHYALLFICALYLKFVEAFPHKNHSSTTNYVSSTDGTGTAVPGTGGANTDCFGNMKTYQVGEFIAALCASVLLYSFLVMFSLPTEKTCLETVKSRAKSCCPRKKTNQSEGMDAPLAVGDSINSDHHTNEEDQDYTNNSDDEDDSHRSTVRADRSGNFEYPNLKCAYKIGFTGLFVGAGLAAYGIFDMVIHGMIRACSNDLTQYRPEFAITGAGIAIFLNSLLLVLKTRKHDVDVENKNEAIRSFMFKENVIAGLGAVASTACIIAALNK